MANRLLANGLADDHSGKESNVHGPHNFPKPTLSGVRPATMQALESFMQTAHLQRQAAARSLARDGSRFAHMAYLRILAEDDGLSQRDLAERMHVSKPTVTTTLNAMEHEGLVERRADAKDRRLTRIYLTDAGRVRDEELKAGLSRFVRDTFGTLSDEEALELSRLLDEVSLRIRTMLESTEGSSD